jgi:hypothetical protein
LDDEYSLRGSHSLHLEVDNTGTGPSGMQLRLLSGGGTTSNNLHDGNKAMGNQGYLRFFLRLEPGNDPLYTAVHLDDGNIVQQALERSSLIEIVDDGEWHLCQWNLVDAEQWSNYSGGNGAIDGPNTFLDSLYFSSAPATSGGTNWKGSIWIDTVAYNPIGDLTDVNRKRIPEPSTVLNVVACLLCLAPITHRVLGLN